VLPGEQNTQCNIYSHMALHAENHVYYDSFMMGDKKEKKSTFLRPA